MKPDDEKAVIDATIESLFKTGQIEPWCHAQEIVEVLGWPDGFKAVVWSLTRLTQSGVLTSKVVGYRTQHKRGEGEQRRIYALPVTVDLGYLPQWLRPQGLRK